jgi:ribulose-phosphate 3-epimerase
MHQFGPRPRFGPRSMIDARNPECELEVDGGIDHETAPLVVEAGARMLVAGSAIYGAAEGVASAMNRLRGRDGLALHS